MFASGPLKTGQAKYNNRHNSAVHYQIVLQFSVRVRYGSAKAAKRLKSTSGYDQDGGRHANCKWLNRKNSAGDFRFG